MKEFVVTKFAGDRERARQEARRLIESHAVEPLPPAVDAALEQIASATSSARRALMEEAPVEVLEQVPFTLELREVVRLLGYVPGRRPPTPPVAARIEEMVAESRSLVEPRGCYAIKTLAEAPGSGPFRGAEKIAFSVTTIGRGIEDRVAELSAKGETLRALVLDAIGSASVEAVTDVVNAEICKRVGQAGVYTNRRISPGYRSWPIEGQAEIFSAAAEPAVRRDPEADLLHGAAQVHLGRDQHRAARAALEVRLDLRLLQPAWLRLSARAGPRPSGGDGPRLTGPFFRRPSLSDLPPRGGSGSALSSRGAACRISLDHRARSLRPAARKPRSASPSGSKAPATCGSTCLRPSSPCSAAAPRPSPPTNGLRRRARARPALALSLRPAGPAQTLTGNSSKALGTEAGDAARGTRVARK